ncbi:MAG: yjjW [Bacteroidetes bacterium]|nr:yjjW [Bacteroidota bacterium]
MPAYPKLIVYYFSGTGNSANVARWISDAGLAMGMQTDVVNIAHVKRLNIPVPDDDALIAFCSPVHGFNYPPVMQSFIRRFPKGKNPVLLLNTRAGMLIGQWITPGLSGITFYLSALILKLKGYRIQAMLPVDLPSNWISVHPGLNRRTVEYLHIRNRERVEAFAQKVLNGQNDFRSVREIIQDIIISPVSLAYLLAGRFFFAKTYFASAACTHCNACIEQCPVKAIKSVANRPFWTFKCESCMHCMSYCPHKAIETAHGSILAFALIFSSIIWVAVIQLAGTTLHLDNALISFGIQTALMIFLLGVWYRIIHFLLRYKWVERIITYTSLTRYKFWGKRYKALKK